MLELKVYPFLHFNSTEKRYLFLDAVGGDEMCDVILELNFGTVCMHGPIFCMMLSDVYKILSFVLHWLLNVE